MLGRLLGGAAGQRIAGVPKPAGNGPAPQRAAAAVEHGRPHVGERAVAARQPVPQAEPGEDVLHDVLGGRPVTDQEYREPHQFRMTLAEEHGHVVAALRSASVPGSRARYGSAASARRERGRARRRRWLAAAGETAVRPGAV